MNASIVLAIASVLGAGGVPGELAARTADPPVRLWLNPSYGWTRGDRVEVDVRAAADGYLLVLHADPAGRVRVLFPLDPFEDHFVRGGRKYEVRGRGDRHTFTIYESRGVGTVLAAWSPDPFRLAEFARGDHWDYTLASTWDAGDDAEVYLLGLAQRMVGGSILEYDVVQYDVGGWAAYNRPVGYSRLSLYHDHYYDRWSVGISIGWGWPYYYSSYYYRPWYYDPWYYDPWYDPWYYRPAWYWGTCLGWCSPRYYYGYGYYRYPRTVVINNYYGFRDGWGYRVGRWDGGAYTFKPNPEPRFAPVEPRQRAPLAMAVSRRLASEPVGVATGRRTEVVAPARRVLGVGGRRVQPAIGGGERRTVTPADPRRAGVRDPATVQGRTPNRVEPERRTLRDRAALPADQGRTQTGTTTPQGRLEPRRSVLRERATTPERAPQPAEPRRSTLRERAITPAEPRENLESREFTPRRELERERMERPGERGRPAAERERGVREREPAPEVRPRLEPRREPAREPPRAAPERRSAPSRDPGPSVRSAPPRSSGPSARPAPSAPRSSPPAPPARPSGGARRRG